MEVRLFFPFDEVQYCGDKLRGELRGKLGTICARVLGSKQSFVVSFGNDAYVMDESLLEKYDHSSKENAAKIAFDISKRRGKKNDG